MNNMLRLVVSFASADRLSGSLRGIVGLAQSGSERLAGMKREARDLDRELRDVRSELGRSTGNVTALMERENALQSQIARTNGEMERQVRLLKIENQTAAMRARGDALKQSGQGNVMGGAAMLAPLVVMAKGAADFQSGMTDIALKADLSQQATAKLEGQILSAARAAKQLPESMRAGVDVLAGFGMTPQEATNMIVPIGKVATAARADIADIASASYANFSNLKVPINETSRALEIMTAAGNSGAFEIKDMAQYFPTLTAQAQAFGQHGVSAVADLAAAAQIARKGTGDSASAATNLTNLLSKINTKDTIANFAKMGVDLPAALKKAYAEGKTPIEAIAELTNKTLGGKLDKISFLFGDMQTQEALRPLIQNMDEYRKIRADALASKGAVDAAFARRSEDAATQARALMGNMQSLAFVAGPVLLPPLIKISEYMLAITDRIAAWAQANPQAAGTIMSLVAGAGALRVGLGILQLAFGSLLGPMASGFGFLMRNGPIIMRTFGLIRTAAMFLARGVLQAGLMMLANPMVLAIVAITAAIGLAAYLIYTHWDTIKGAWDRGVANVSANVAVVRGAISAGIDWLTALPSRFAAAGSAMMQGLVNGISSRVAAIKSMIFGIAGNVVSWFKNVLGIHSPSRVFMGLGGHITSGLAIGLDKSSPLATGAAKRLAAGVAGISFAAPALAAGQADRAPTALNSRLEPLGARSPQGGAGAGAAGAFSIGNVTIHVHAQPGQSPQDIGQAVADALRNQADRAAAAARSRYSDD